MTQFLDRYRQYRHVGFNRFAALHFAWLVTVGVRHASAPKLARR